MVRISNQKLIKILKRNSKIKFTELARIFGVSETAVRKRIKKLEKEGIIKSYTIEVDVRGIGYKVDAFLGIDVLPEKYLQILEDLRNDERVVDLYSTSGDHMIIARIWFKDYDDFKNYIQKLEKTEGVIKVCPATIIEKIK